MPVLIARVELLGVGLLVWREAAGRRTSDGNLGRTLTFCCFRLATINIWPHPVVVVVVVADIT